MCLFFREKGNNITRSFLHSVFWRYEPRMEQPNIGAQIYLGLCFNQFASVLQNKFRASARYYFP